MADLTEVLVPDIGDYTDVPVIEVLVAVGDEIAPEDPLVVLESDKATMEVPSTAAGTVDSIAVSEGDTVSEGDLILKLSVSDSRETSSEQEESDEAESQEQTEEHSPTSAEKPSEDADDAVEEASDDDDGSEDDREVAYAGPAARKLAREMGVDLGAVAGSGRNGRITTEDVRAAADGAESAGDADESAQPSGRAAPADLPAWPEVDHESYGAIDRAKLSRIKRIAGPALARNWAMIPHVTQFDRADITELEEFRREVNAAHADDGVKVTMVSLLLKASASALRTFPEFNSSLDGEHLVLKRHYHLGFAVDTPDGLLVPVIRDVDRKGLLEIARELVELSGAARDGSIGSEDMRGGTFTISSLGGIGGTAFTPIINAPEVAILGASRATMEPIWDGSGFRPRLMLPLSLSYDHRVVDGAAAARFTTHLGELLSDPRRMLL